uniref:Uncharacterized protein n=1 Tax=Anguilla anguilla TaxID=7936 RepID=A0A0E9UTP6_ANGAN
MTPSTAVTMTRGGTGTTSSNTLEGGIALSKTRVTMATGTMVTAATVGIDKPKNILS